jgi:hypothetical protein
MKRGYEPGSHGCHEALHMASFFINSVDDELVEHPAIKANEEWSRLAQVALDALFELYQAIGQQHR